MRHGRTLLHLTRMGLLSFAVVALTKSRIAFFAGPSFQDGSGSSARTGAATEGVEIAITRYGGPEVLVPRRASSHAAFICAPAIVRSATTS